MKLYILGELPETAVDLCHMNVRRPEIYNDIYTVYEQVIQDWAAEDDQQHGVAHLSKLISIRDLHDDVHLMYWYHQRSGYDCSSCLPIPMQFRPFTTLADFRSTFLSKAACFVGVAFETLFFCHQGQTLSPKHSVCTVCLF